MSSCAIFDERWEPTIPNWPLLEVKEYHVKTGVIEQKCAYALTALTRPVACSVITFNKNLCEMYLPENNPDAFRPHEMMHCEGHDHAGEHILLEAFNKWKGLLSAH